MRFKPSKYNYIYCTGTNYVVYNLSSGGAAVLDREAVDLLSNPSDSSYLGQFRSLGFVVPWDVDELSLVNSRRYATMFGEFGKKFFTVLPTTSCNARCSYCYEQGWKAHTMDEATALATANFIIDECAGGVRPDVIWFGGEPLLGVEAIRTISDAMRHRMPQGFNASMVTNGFLLDEKTVEEAVSSWNISSIQVPLDDIYGEYERRKSFVCNSKGSFDRVAQNIKSALSAGISVIARINVDRRNFSNSENMLAFLSSEFGRWDNFDAYFYPLQSVGVGEIYNKDFFREDEYQEVMSRLLGLRYQYGFIKNLDYATYPMLNAGCSARTLSAYVVDPEGKLYKCQHILESDCIGNVFEGPRYNEAYANFCDPSLPDECVECIYLPKCHGGCLVHHLHGNASCPKCQMIKYDIDERCKILLEMGK